MEECDVLVVGAGPIGAVFSYIAAKNGLDVLILERKNEVASPLRGGEAVSKFLFTEICEEVPHLKNTYTWPIEETLIYTPAAKFISREDKWKSFMLNRKDVEKQLVQNALNAGARLVLGATVESFSFNGKNVSEVRADTISGSLTVKPKIVVGADGACSIVRRILIGERNYAGVKDWGCAIELEVTNLELDANSLNSMQLFMGEVPGGYGYIFPKGSGRADVGVGTRPFYGKEPELAKSPLELFYELVKNNSILKRQVRKASPLEIKGGIIDLSRPIYPVFGNAILVGDAANQNFAYVGEGIIPGWQAAIIAGKKVAEAIEKEDNQILEEYPREYDASFIGMEARKTVAIKDNIGKVLSMNIKPELKTILTSMLELEIIDWNGKQLKTALSFTSVKELLKYAEKLVEKKEMKVEISQA